MKDRGRGAGAGAGAGGGYYDGGSFLAVDSLGLCHINPPTAGVLSFLQGRSLEKIRNFWELVSFHVGHLKIDRCQKKNLNGRFPSVPSSKLFWRATVVLEWSLTKFAEFFFLAQIFAGEERKFPSSPSHCKNY